MAGDDHTLGQPSVDKVDESLVAYANELAKDAAYEDDKKKRYSSVTSDPYGTRNHGENKGRNIGAPIENPGEPDGQHYATNLSKHSKSSKRS